MSAAAVVFLLSLVPSLAAKDTRISRRTSVPTAAAAWVQGVTMLTLGLVFSGGLTLAIAGAWTAIAVWRPLKA